jgi:hypothetical protein
VTEAQDGKDDEQGPADMAGAIGEEQVMDEAEGTSGTGDTEAATTEVATTEVAKKVAAAKVKATLAADTAEVPAVGAVDPDPDGDPDGLDDAWEEDSEDIEHARELKRRRAKRARQVTAALALVAAIGIGFAGGVYYQKHEGGSSTAASAFPGAGAFRRAIASASGSGTSSTSSSSTSSSSSSRSGSSSFPSGLVFGGGAGGICFPGAGTCVSGTVETVTGGTLYVTESSGNALVKVETNSSSSVTAVTKSTVSAIHPGDTVTVHGATQKDGSFVAGTIKDTGSGS